MDLSNPWLSLLAALFGGVGLKVTDFFLGRGKAKSDIATELRTELRQDVRDLRETLSKEAKESEAWQQKYYQLFEQYVALQSDYRALRLAYEEKTGDAVASPSLPDLQDLIE